MTREALYHLKWIRYYDDEVDDHLKITAILRSMMDVDILPRKPKYQQSTRSRSEDGDMMKSVRLIEKSWA